jgi:hypothetical protein
MAFNATNSPVHMDCVVKINIVRSFVNSYPGNRWTCGNNSITIEVFICWKLSGNLTTGKIRIGMANFQKMKTSMVMELLPQVHRFPGYEFTKLLTMFILTTQSM